MPNYDFTDSLSPIDFELLVKDLLEAELGIRLENFKEGKDGGIDLRHAARNSDDRTIVQCKRYGPKDYSNLKSKLKLEELPKIRKLNPSRYILATSVELSPTQSDELKDLLAPYVETTDDIFGRDRLNSLLAKHEEVERRHNKLWISSTALLEEFLNSGIHVISRKEVKDAIRAAKLYVKNESFGEALNILSEHRVCIVSGIPGIGKTTLARMLLLYFKDLGYEIVKIDDDVSEARGLHFHGKPKFYYYDDFLGQTSLSSKFNKNEDKRLLSFMDQIAESENSVFVLTTREYVLKQAKMIYEPFDNARLDTRKCIVDLEKYSRRIRAQILYNHIFFSDLEEGYVKSLISSGTYKAIVDHDNYSPRLVQYLTSKEWVGDAGQSGYADKFVSSLDNPILLWTHAFERQIHRSSQDLLLLLSSLPIRVDIRDLELAFNSFREVRASVFGETRTPQEFKDSLRELEATFVTIQVVSNGSLVSYHNPSIRDFIEPRVLEDAVFKHLITGAPYFEQISWCFKTAVEYSEAAGKGLSAVLAKFIESRMIDLYRSPCCRTVYRHNGGDEGVLRRGANWGRRLDEILTSGRIADSERGVEFVEAEMAVMAESEGYEGCPQRATKVLKYVAPFNLEGAREGSPLVVATKNRLLDAENDLDMFETIAEFQSLFPNSLTEAEAEELRRNLTHYIDEETANNFGYSCDDPDDFRNIAERIESLGRDFGVDTESSCKKLNDAADEKETMLEETRDWDPDDEMRGVSVGASDSFSDPEMDSMFRTLE